MITPTPNNRYVIPDLAEFISRRMRDISARINCHTIGQIVSFNSENQTAVVNISFMKVVQGVNPIGDTGYTSSEIVSYPQLVDVPVIVLQGGGGRLTFPIVPGESCLILFCDRDMDSWFNAGLVAAPNSNRVHDINDAVALVGLNNLQNAISDYDPDNVELHSETNLNITAPNGLVSVTDRTSERLAQSGDLKVTARSTAPSGWILSYGQSISKTTYPDLFLAIGYTYGGSGDNFNVPDLRGRTPIGLDNMGGSSANVLTNAYTPNRNTLGGNIGEQTHTLIISEMPAHTHTMVRGNLDASGVYGAAGNDPTFGLATTSSTGGDQPHYNVQPGIMLNWLIKI